MTSEVWAFLGVALTALLAFAAAYLSTHRDDATSGRSASADEVVALGARLDKQGIRMDGQDRKIRALYEYIAEDHAEHRRHGWEIRPLPQEIA